MNTHQTPARTLDRRSFLKLAGMGALLVPAALAGCSASNSNPTAATSAASPSDAATTATDIAGMQLTFVGDDAFAPYRSLEVQPDGTQKVVGLDIAVADEMASRLGFTYTFEAQDFAATLASVQASDTAFTMAMSSNEEREKTYDFTQGYYQPLVGVLTNGGDPIESVDALKGKVLTCTEGTVQHKFILAVLPDAEVHTFDGGDQCLQEVLAGRVDAYVCDGAEGLAMQQANAGTVIGMLPRESTSDYVGVYRIMATKGAGFVAAFDACVAEMRADGTLDKFITQWVGEQFAWGDGGAGASTATTA